MPTDRNPRLDTDYGTYWGLPGISAPDNGWYLAGTFDQGYDGWKTLRGGATPETMDRQIRNLTGYGQVSVAYVVDGEVVAYRTVHGPFAGTKSVVDHIEIETKVNSPV